MISVIGPVQSRCHEGSPVGKRSLSWEGFVEKVDLSHCERVKKWWMMRAGMREMRWRVDEEVNQDENVEADGMNLDIDSKDEVMHI